MKHFYISFKQNKNNNKSTILFLHGWGGNKDSFFYLYKNLSRKFNTISIDFFGFGYSKLFKEQLSIYDYANELYLFLKENNITNLSIVCHSFGFRVATVLSSLYDINVEKILVFSGAGVKPRFNLITYLKIKFYKIKKKFSTKYKIEDIKDRVDLYKTFVKVVNEHLNFLYKNIDSKVLLVWGKKDKSVKIYMLKYLKRKIKDCNSTILNGDHFAYLKNKHKSLMIANKFLTIV